MIEEGRMLLTKEWQISLSYLPREENRNADYLAKAAHTTIENYVILEHPPPLMNEVVADEG